jgi:hypothetical protein
VLGKVFQVLQRGNPIASLHGIHRLHVDLFTQLVGGIRAGHGLLMGSAGDIDSASPPGYIGARAMGERKLGINCHSLIKGFDSPATLAQP